MWPMTTHCKSSGKDLDYCDDDYDCAPGLFCHYSTAAEGKLKIRRCMKAFNLPLISTFGFDNIAGNSELENAIHNGRVCKSGLAYFNQTTFDTAICLEITGMKETIKTGISKTIVQNEILPPFACNAKDVNSTCEWHIANVGNISHPCQCSLDGSKGYCQRPGKQEMIDYGTGYNKIMSNQRCHTKDRINVYALMECSILSMADLKSNMKFIYNFEYWPFIRGNNTCLNLVHPMSPDIINLGMYPNGATMLKWSAAAVSGSLALFSLIY